MLLYNECAQCIILNKEAPAVLQLGQTTFDEKTDFDRNYSGAYRCGLLVRPRRPQITTITALARAAGRNEIAHHSNHLRDQSCRRHKIRPVCHHPAVVTTKLFEVPPRLARHPSTSNVNPDGGVSGVGQPPDKQPRQDDARQLFQGVPR